MNGFKTAVFAELKKAAGKKKIKVAALLCLIAVIVSALVCVLAGSFMGVNMTGKTEFSITVLPVFLKFLIPLFTIFMCIDMFGGEYNSGTMKTTLLMGKSRWKVFFSKAFVLGAFILAMLAFTMVTSFIAGVILGKTEMAVFRVFFSYLISFVPLMTFAFMCMLISNIVKGSGAAFMLSVIFYLALYVLSILFPGVSPFFYTSAFDVYVLLSTPLLSIGRMLRMLVILIGYGALFSGLGVYLFDRKEL